MTPNATVTDHFVLVDTPLCTARVALLGGQVLQWAPRGERPVMWLSPRAALPAQGAPVEPVGKAIRGGAPVCFPWFGKRAGDDAAPQHGFARTTRWTVAEVAVAEDGRATVELALSSSAATRALWAHDFELRLRATFGAALTMTLSVTNTGASALTCEQALHTYLAVGDVRDVALRGLQQAPFLDKTQGFARSVAPDAPLAIVGEVDRVYTGHVRTVVVEDGDRELHIEKRGSRTTVVWNPGEAAAAKIADIGDAWSSFVCVETANVGDDAVVLAPSQVHELTATLHATPRA